MLTPFANLPQDLLRHELLPHLDDISLLLLRATLFDRKIERCDIIAKDALIVSHDISVIEYFRNLKLISQETITYCAALNGQLDVLQYCKANNYIFHAQLHVAAATAGSYNCLKYVLDNGHVPYIDTLIAAIRSGASGCLQLLDIMGITRDAHERYYVVREAIRTGNVICAQIVVETLLRIDSFIVNITVGEPLAKCDNVEMFTYLNSQRFVMNDLVKSCCTHGAINILRRVYELYPERIPEDAIIDAIRCGQLAIIRFLHGIGQRDPNGMTTASCRLYEAHCVRELLNLGYTWVPPTEGSFCLSLSMLQFLQEMNYNFTSSTLSDTIHVGCLDSVKFLRSLNVPWPTIDDNLLDIYRMRHMSREQADTIVYALKNGCPYDVHTLSLLMQTPLIIERW